ncbi:unnamed protein product [Rotaria sp. Silwood1]|nr:unnamed protein product [Rotaria sp. Silwood1]
MDIYTITEISDDMMNLSYDKFYDFLDIVLNKDLSNLFRVQAIREMSSLSSLTVDELIEILNYDIVELHSIREKLGFISSDGRFHLRLGFRNLLERLLSLVKLKKNSLIKNLELTQENTINDMYKKLMHIWKQAPSSSNENKTPILILWINNIFKNLKKSKNKFSYDEYIQQFSLLLLILGGRNCYEFLRLNLPGALPHVSNVELLMKNQDVRIVECNFRFDLLRDYTQSNNCNYVFSAEDSTGSICRVEYDAHSNSFIGFSTPLVHGVPKPNFFQTERFDELKSWFDNFDKSKFINLHMIQSIKPFVPPLILSTYGSNNKATSTDVLKRWLYIYNKSLAQGVRVIGFSTDGDSRYLRAMRLCSRFFAELPNLTLFKNHDEFSINIPRQWSWFFMKEQQILLFMQDPIHVATKFRNRLLSQVASMKMGKYLIDKEHIVYLIESYSKIEHNLIKCDINIKDRQNFPSCRRISSVNVLNLLNNENFKGTYVYLSLLRSIIIGFIEKSSTIEERLYHIWTVVFTCRLWWSWIHYWTIKNSRNDDNSALVKQLKSNSFITKPTFWCSEINAHTFLYIILLVIKNKLPVDALNTYLFNSQTCENTFRIARALSGPYSSITNFTVKSFINRCEKISIINSIKTHSGHIGHYQFKFPQHHKHDKEVHVYSVNPLKQINLTEFDIEKIIQKAFESAKNYVTMVNMNELLKNKNLFSLPELSQFIKTNISKSSSKVVDYTEDIDFDEDSDKDEFDDEDSDKDEFDDEDSDKDEFDDEDSDKDEFDDEDNPETFDDQDEILSNSDDEVEDEGNVLTSDLSDTEKKIPRLSYI